MWLCLRMVGTAKFLAIERVNMMSSTVKFGTSFSDNPNIVVPGSMGNHYSFDPWLLVKSLFFWIKTTNIPNVSWIWWWKTMGNPTIKLSFWGIIDGDFEIWFMAWKTWIMGVPWGFWLGKLWNYNELYFNMYIYIYNIWYPQDQI